MSKMSDDSAADNSEQRPDQSIWDAEQVLRTCEFEREAFNMTPEQQVRSTFIQNAPVAARAINYLALYSRDEVMRLRAATYVVDQALGRPDSVGMVDDAEDILAQLVKGIIVPAE